MGYYLLIYFLAGVLQDFLPSVFSFVVTLVSMFVLYNILTRLDEERSIVAIIVYAVGIVVGTLLGMKARLSLRK